jgi:urocanate hydratase
MMGIATRLKQHIEAISGAAVEVSIGSVGNAESVRLEPDSQAARQALSEFDWSQAAHDVWREGLQPERRSVRQAAAQAITDNDTFLALASPTNAQTLAQVKRLTQQNARIIQRLVQID